MLRTARVRVLPQVVEIAEMVMVPRQETAWVVVMEETEEMEVTEMVGTGMEVLVVLVAMAVVMAVAATVVGMVRAVVELAQGVREGRLPEVVQALAVLVVLSVVVLVLVFIITQMEPILATHGWKFMGMMSAIINS